jgi:hypothetical protein
MYLATVAVSKAREVVGEQFAIVPVALPAENLPIAFC